MSIAKEPQFTLENEKILSASPGWKLDAWAFTPSNRTGPHPVIIMCANLVYSTILTQLPSSTKFLIIWNEVSYT